jgi:hypothetical protein
MGSFDKEVENLKTLVTRSLKGTVSRDFWYQGHHSSYLSGVNDSAKAA